MSLSLLTTQPSLDEFIATFDRIVDEVARTEAYLNALYRSMGYTRTRKRLAYGANYAMMNNENLLQRKWRKHMRIELEHLPDPMLSPNKRPHWRKKHKHASLAKEEAMLRAIKAGRPMNPYEKSHITVTFVAKDKRRRDPDNLIASMKPYIDGIVRAGVIKDDSVFNVSYTFKYELGKEANTIIDIEKK